MRRVRRAAETYAICYWSVNAKKNSLRGTLRGRGGTPREPRGSPEGTPTHPEQSRNKNRDTRPTGRGRGRDPGDALLTHAWKSDDVSDGDVASDVTSHTMVSTITTIKRMVIAVCHHEPVAWHGTDL
jgi:hypothetical protein